MKPGDRVLYVPPYPPERPRFGVLCTISGQSAEIQYDGCIQPTWAPLGRLYAATPSVNGWLQLHLVSDAGGQHGETP